MRPVRLVLHNYCQHEDLELTFVEGMNNISGRNGSGKSNIFDALQLCLGHDSNNAESRSSKVTDNIRIGCTRAWTKLEFEHDGEKGLIQVDLTRNYDQDSEVINIAVANAKMEVDRATSCGEDVLDSVLKLSKLKPSESTKYKLVWQGETFTKKGQIAQVLSDLMLITPATVSSNYFPKQGDVDAVIGADVAQRQKVFHDKAGTAMCERVWKMLGEAIRGEPELEGVTEEFEKARVKVAELRAAHTRVEAEVQELGPCPGDYDQVMDVVRSYNAAQEQSGRADAARSQVVILSDKVEKLKAKANEIKRSGIDLAERVRNLEVVGEQSRLLLLAHQEMADLKVKLDNMSIDLSKSKEELGQLGEEPLVPEGDIDDLIKSISDLELRIASENGFISKFDEGRCPTCGQEVEGGKARADEARDFVDRKTGELTGLRNKANAFKQAKERAESAQREWQRNQVRLTTRIEQLSADLLEAGKNYNASHIQDPGGLTKLRQQVEDAKVSATELDKLRGLHNAAVDSYNASKSRLDSAQAVVDTLVETATGPSEEEFRKASALVSEIQIWRSKERDVALRVSESSARLRTAEEDLVSRKDKFDAADPIRRWTTMLAKARDLFHKDSKPAEVVRWYADQMVQQTMKHLELFDSEFRVRVTEDLTLMCDFPDKMIPAMRLSGGQKNMLNLSMRLAMFDLFPSQLQLLVLDEVEVHLDQENVARLPIVLERVKGLARSRGLVVLFVSHHPSLSNISDHEIKLAA